MAGKKSRNITIPLRILGRPDRIADDLVQGLIKPSSAAILGVMVECTNSVFGLGIPTGYSTIAGAGGATILSYMSTCK